MTDREALLRAVCENPDNDLPRLVFADWLEEHGDPERAELIRLQCELERRSVAGVARVRAVNRVVDLLSANEARWAAQQPQPPGAWLFGPFDRGFVAGLHVQAWGHFFSAAEQVFVTVPVRRMEVAHLPDPGQLATIPALARLRHLQIGLGAPDPASVERFATAGLWDRLERLVVIGPGLEHDEENLLRARFGNRLSRELTATPPAPSPPSAESFPF